MLMMTPPAWEELGLTGSSFALVPFAETLYMGLVSHSVWHIMTELLSILFLGEITLGNILEILPFSDPVVVLELDGDAIWSALESSLSTWPAQEG